MKKVTDILKKKKFTVSVELVPPRNGTSPDELFEKLKSLKGIVDFVSVTKGAGGSLRGGTLPISYFAQEKYGINTIAHFVCRERTKYEIENDLIDLHYFGINNVLALRGDPPAGNKEEKWDGDYKYAFNLIKQISDMNKGLYVPRVNFDEGLRKGEKSGFCIIAAGHPEDPIAEEIKHMKAKVEAGAEVIITQMVFCFEDYKNYVEALRGAGIKIPVIPGVRPLVSLKQAESVEKFFGLKVPKELIEGLKKGKEFGLRYSQEFIKKLKEYGAPGVHFFVLNDVELVKEII